MGLSENKESTDLPVVHNLIFRHTHIIAWHNLHNLDVQPAVRSIGDTWGT